MHEFLDLGISILGSLWPDLIEKNMLFERSVFYDFLRCQKIEKKEVRARQGREQADEPGPATRGSKYYFS